jgi:hypothetical protein
MTHAAQSATQCERLENAPAKSDEIICRKNDRVAGRLPTQRADVGVAGWHDLRARRPITRQPGFEVRSGVRPGDRSLARKSTRSEGTQPSNRRRTAILFQRMKPTIRRQWLTLAPLPSGRPGFGAAAVSQYVYTCAALSDAAVAGCRVSCWFSASPEGTKIVPQLNNIQPACQSLRRESPPTGSALGPRLGSAATL